VIRLELAHPLIDQRGLIQDLLAAPIDSVRIVRTKQHAVRGNHRHDQTTEWTYVLKGKLLVVTQAEAEAAVNYEHARTGDFFVDPPGQAHAWQALEDSTCLVLSQGRGADLDTQALSEALIAGRPPATRLEPDPG
jgi:quercetin dioxygenase-like cupin family protein